MRANTLKYRINFGNGQVAYLPYGGKREYLRFAIEQADGHAYVQFQDPDTGEWFCVGSIAPSGRKEK